MLYLFISLICFMFWDSYYNILKVFLENVYTNTLLFLCVSKAVVLAKFACGNKKVLNADSLHMASWSTFVYLFQLVHAGVRCWISLRSGDVSLYIWYTVVMYSVHSCVCIFYKSYMLIWNSNFLTLHIIFCFSVFFSTYVDCCHTL